MPTDRRELIAKLREREQDLRAACEYVGGGVKGIIFAEVAENARDAADALEQAETELSSLRERERRIRAIVNHVRRVPTDCWGNPDLGSHDWPSTDEVAKAVSRIAALLAPSPADHEWEMEQTFNGVNYVSNEVCVRCGAVSNLGNAPKSCPSPADRKD